MLAVIRMVWLSCAILGIEPKSVTCQQSWLWISFCVWACWALQQIFDTFSNFDSLHSTSFEWNRGQGMTNYLYISDWYPKTSGRSLTFVIFYFFEFAKKRDIFTVHCIISLHCYTYNLFITIYWWYILKFIETWTRLTFFYTINIRNIYTIINYTIFFSFSYTHTYRQSRTDR